VRGFPRVRRDLLLAIEPALVPELEGSADSEVLFHLALTFGLEDDPVTALERMAGFVEQVGEAHGVEHPLQMSVAVTDGTRIVAARYSSERSSRSLFYSTDARALKEQHPENERIQTLSDEARAVVSEPLGEMVGAWNEVPEAHVGIVQAGDDELRPFTPRPRGRAAPP
jgi:predicted glutamine amidotransferase